MYRISTSLASRGVPGGVGELRAQERQGGEAEDHGIGAHHPTPHVAVVGLLGRPGEDALAEDQGPIEADHHVRDLHLKSFLPSTILLLSYTLLYTLYT